jgi:galactonate dehydratase
MKIWPFDIAAERSGGLDITPQEMRTALEPFAKIRKAVGDRMQIMVEFHSLWSLPMAKRLAQRLAEFDTYWHEDPFRLDHLSDLKEYAAHSKAWTCASETLAYTHAFRDYLESGAADVFMASCHFSLHARNALIQEGVRAFYTGWYKELVTNLPVVDNGMVTVGTAPGLGLELLPDVPLRKDAIVRKSER